MNAELEARIRHILEKQGSAVIAIDGNSGAGKTTFAGELASCFGGRVFHADDYFPRPFQRTPQRLREPGGNFDRERFFEEVVKAVTKKRDAHIRKFDCHLRRLGEKACIPYAPVTVVEGSYCLHPALGKYWDISVFLELCPEAQHRRIVEREGEEGAKRFVSLWIPLENLYFTSLGIRQKTDFTIINSNDEVLR